MPSKLKYNRKHAIKSVIAGVAFITLLVMSLSLSHYWLTHQLTSVAVQIDQKYQQRHLAAKAQMQEVQAMLQEEQENHCSEETIGLLKNKLFKQNDQPVPWVRFNDDNYICSAIGRWPVPAGGHVISRGIDGNGLVRGDDARTFNKQRTIYASVIDGATKVFVPVQSAEAIYKVLAKCQMCGGIKVKVNGQDWISQNADGNPFASVSYQAKNSEFNYTLIANESARNQLWLTVFLLLLLPMALLAGIGYLFREPVLKLYWHRRFVSALKKEAFYLAYQPIVDTKSNQVFGVETLLRWRNKNGKCRETSSYIKVLEQDSVMPQLTKWMIRTALSELKSLLRSNKIARCSINVSAYQIEQQDLLPYLQLLANKGYPVDQLCFELTERQPIQSWQAVREFIAGCKQLGCCIKLDDVGVGYGGGLLIQQLEFDGLKINKAFTKLVLSEHHQPFLISSYVAIAKEINISLVAEGVETLEQANYLKELGVYLHQGWLYSKALAATELRAYLLNS
ncbi:EAL domain-containing protein [Shewanella sp. Isolate13]|uniref:EAL domain-containing protein n=1 Tax=Shewanella sp. Isolate13 TaxID=2908531 RepID=UPI001EFDC17C|nr:EAL domain-containing protein [Shewanella sp. Isolate13]MCG9730367.1 EAL domain-containing protein [Shewanella sp. Isolate13]